MLDAQRQFGRRAHRYARSYIHRRGRSLTAARHIFGIRVRGGTIRWAWDNAIFLTVREP